MEFPGMQNDFLSACAHQMVHLSETFLQARKYHANEMKGGKSQAKQMRILGLPHAATLKEDCFSCVSTLNSAQEILPKRMDPYTVI